MLTSKQLLSRTGISRATLYNYISLGILPKPVQVKTEGRRRPVSHFSPEALATIIQVNNLKRRGISMLEIASILKKESSDTVEGTRLPANESSPPEERRGDDRRSEPAKGIENVPGGGLRLTIDQVTTPAYMINTRFELEWVNDEAKTKFGTLCRRLSRDISERNIFGLFYRDETMMRAESRVDIMLFHMSIAKNRFSRTALLTADPDMSDEEIDDLGRLYDQAEPAPQGQVLHTQVNLAPRGEDERWHEIYASTFREGYFIVYTPITDDQEALMQLLGRRDIVIRDLMKRRRPYLTQVAFVVADIQNSVKICSELPPEEYFELINDVWQAMAPKIRKYYATHGKHVGDGIVYYFFPQPDSNYTMNAIMCAHEMKDAMVEISRAWQKRKNWTNELVLNIGMHEGQEWFGTYQTPTHVEVTVLGDTINMAARLSDFARSGSIWISKSMFAQLSSRERERVQYGIRRPHQNGTEVIVEESYARISNLVDLENPRFDKLKDIAALPVTEIINVTPEVEEQQPAKLKPSLASFSTDGAGAAKTLMSERMNVPSPSPHAPEEIQDFPANPRLIFPSQQEQTFPTDPRQTFPSQPRPAKAHAAPHGDASGHDEKVVSFDRIDTGLMHSKSLQNKIKIGLGIAAAIVAITLISSASMIFMSEQVRQIVIDMHNDELPGMTPASGPADSDKK